MGSNYQDDRPIHLVVHGLTYYYDHTSWGIKNISFSVKKGEKLGIVGGNGAGKSTLLLTLGGCLVPQQGEVIIGDTPIPRKSWQNLLPRYTGLIFQDPDDQLVMPTLWEDIGFGLRSRGYSPQEVEQRSYQILESLGLIHLKNRAPYQLSGGEKRLATLAAILVLEPEILLLDEPSSALDPLARRKIIRTLSQLPHTQLIASHDLDFIWELCDRILILQQGQLIQEGDTHSLLKNKKLLEEVNLELPLSLQGCPICNPR